MNHHPNINRAVASDDHAVSVRTLVYGAFDTDHGRDPSVGHTARMLRANQPVYTVAGSADASAHHRVDFSTNYKYDKTTAALFERAQLCGELVIFISALVTPKFTSRHVWRRIKQRVRMIKMINRFLTMGKPVRLIGTSLDQRLLRTMITIPDDARVMWQLPPDAPVARNDAQIVALHARRAYRPDRADATDMLIALRSTKTDDPALEKLCRLALTHRLQRHPLVQRITQHSGDQIPITRTKPPYPLLATAMAQTERDGLADYATHLFRLFASTPNRPVEDWYVQNAHRLVPSGWAPPLEPTGPSVQFAGLQNVQLIEQLLAGERQLASLPDDLQTLA